MSAQCLEVLTMLLCRIGKHSAMLKLLEMLRKKALCWEPWVFRSAWGNIWIGWNAVSEDMAVRKMGLWSTKDVKVALNTLCAWETLVVAKVSCLDRCCLLGCLLFAFGCFLFACCFSSASIGFRLRSNAAFGLLLLCHSNANSAWSCVSYHTYTTLLFQALQIFKLAFCTSCVVHACPHQVIHPNRTLPTACRLLALCCGFCASLQSSARLSLTCKSDVD